MPRRLFPIPLADQIACVEREVRRRRALYPRLVQTERLFPATAERELRTMAAVLETLLALAQTGRAARPNPGDRRR